jgi:hypothetical protein
MRITVGSGSSSHNEQWKKMLFPGLRYARSRSLFPVLQGLHHVVVLLSWILCFSHDDRFEPSIEVVGTLYGCFGRRKESIHIVKGISASNDQDIVVA